MNRQIAILLITLVIASLIFSTYALYQGKFVAALFTYALLVLVYFFVQSTKKK